MMCVSEKSEQLSNNQNIVANIGTNSFDTATDGEELTDIESDHDHDVFPSAVVKKGLKSTAILPREYDSTSTGKPNVVTAAILNACVVSMLNDDEGDGISGGDSGGVEEKGERRESGGEEKGGSGGSGSGGDSSGAGGGSGSAGGGAGGGGDDGNGADGNGAGGDSVNMSSTSSSSSNSSCKTSGSARFSGSDMTACSMLVGTGKIGDLTFYTDSNHPLVNRNQSINPADVTKTQGATSPTAAVANTAAGERQPLVERRYSGDADAGHVLSPSVLSSQGQGQGLSSQGQGLSSQGQGQRPASLFPGLRGMPPPIQVVGLRTGRTVSGRNPTSPTSNPGVFVGPRRTDLSPGLSAQAPGQEQTESPHSQSSRNLSTTDSVSGSGLTSVSWTLDDFTSSREFQGEINPN